MWACEHVAGVIAFSSCCSCGESDSGCEGDSNSDSERSAEQTGM
jgi:hypothetical protein